MSRTTTDRAPTDAARPAWAALLFLLALALPAPATADAEERPRFTVLEASTRLVDEVYMLDARLTYALTAEAIEALENGVPLTIELQIQVRAERDLLWDETVAALSLRHTIEYRALADQYLVTNLTTGELSSHTKLAAALTTLGRVRDFPMLDRRLLRVGTRYHTQLRARLDVESLPLPLRPMAYLSSRWGMTSAWHTWQLTP
jgi:hypothetical protein